MRQLVDELGGAGWNVLHFAIFIGSEEIFDYLLELECDVNKLTHDGWSPLQLAISRNHMSSKNLSYTKVFKKLIENDKVDLNDCTSRGTALHVACKLNKSAFI